MCTYCFDSVPVEELAMDKNGTRWDSCIPCVVADGWGEELIEEHAFYGAFFILIRDALRRHNLYVAASMLKIYGELHERLSRRTT